MRRFTDSTGRDWEVVAGRESWGAIYAIFIPVDGGTDLRQAPLAAMSYEQANAELGRLDEPSLEGLLERATPKTMD